MNAAGGDTARPTCRHCTDRPVTRPRGLCFRCFYVPGVKEMYPSTSKYARRGVGLGFGGKTLPAVPTVYAPGTPEKLTVLEERAKAGVALWHPHDARYEGDPLPFVWAALNGSPEASMTRLSDRGIYARRLVPADVPDDHGRDTGRCVLLVTPGTLSYLTPAEARHLAAQLSRAAEEPERAAGEDGGE